MSEYFKLIIPQPINNFRHFEIFFRTVSDAELLVDPALINQQNPSAPLTFGKVQEMIAMQRLINQQQRLREINRSPTPNRGPAISAAVGKSYYHSLKITPSMSLL